MIRVSVEHDSPALPLQRCKRDTLLLQIAGQSDCQVGDAPVWQGRLEAGQALYVPRGTSLSAGSGGARIGFAIENPTGVDLLHWIVEHVQQNEAFQADIPRFADPATKADYVTGLRKVLARALRAPALLEGFRRAANLNAQPVHGERVPWTASAPEDRLISLLTPRKFRIKRANDETILLVAMGNRLGFPLDAAPLLHFLSDRAPVSIAEFYRTFAEEFDREELTEFLKALSDGGIIGLQA
jgi:ribosomal protein L16 Arg81 hydroxylase